jgi:hypothetical protein
MEAGRADHVWTEELVARLGYNGGMVRRWISRRQPGFALFACKQIVALGLIVLYFFVLLSVARFHPLPQKLTASWLIAHSAIYCAILAAASWSIRSVIKDRRKST